MKQIKKKLVKIYRILLGLAVLTLIISLGSSDIFAVREFDCKTQYGPCFNSDTEALESFKGQNLFLVKTDEVKVALAQDFMNRKSEVQRVFPGTLAIVLDKRKPLAALKVLNTEYLILVDHEGVIIEFVESSPLPTITVQEQIQGLSQGQKLNQEITNAVQAFYMTYKTQSIPGAVLSDKTLKFETQEGTTVLYGLDRDPQVLVGALQLILSRSRIEGKTPKLIDLRFSKTVLRYE